MFRSHFHYWIHCGALTEQVHRHDRFSLPGDQALDRAWVDVARSDVNVRKHWPGPEPRNDAGCGEEAVRSRNHLVTRSDVQSHKRDQESVGTGGNANTMLRGYVCRNLLLK